MESEASLLSDRATEFLKQDRVAEAAQAAGKLRELSAGNSTGLYDAACVFARCSAADQGTNGRTPADEGQARRAEFRNRAMSCLKEAFMAGFDDVERARKDPDLLPLADLPEFQKLLSNEAGEPTKGKL